MSSSMLKRFMHSPRATSRATDVAFQIAAAAPRTLGGAAILLTSNGTAAAAQLQRRLCGVLVDPSTACGGGAAWQAAGGSVSAAAVANASVFAAAYRQHLVQQNNKPPWSRLNATALLAALPPIPHNISGFWFSKKEPFEGLSEGVVQNAAAWWVCLTWFDLRGCWSRLFPGSLPPKLHSPTQNL